MNISPLTGLASPFTGSPQWTTFRPETAYEFRFDTNREAKADAIFRFLFHGETHSQAWRLRSINGDDSRYQHAAGGVGNGAIAEITAVADVDHVWIG